MIRHAILQGYAGRLMKGQFPIAAVFITVPYDMVDINVYPTKADIAAGFQEAVEDVPAYKIINAAKQKACRHIAIVGGVAANRRLREKVALLDASKEKFDVYIPSLKLCGDNAASDTALAEQLRSTQIFYQSNSATIQSKDQNLLRCGRKSEKRAYRDAPDGYI
jgi:tRNA A37 threonylcarbamoyltransferase TsaD